MGSGVAASLGTATINIKSDPSGFKKGMAAAVGAAQKLIEKTKELGEGLTKAGTGFLKVGAALSAPLLLGAKSAIKFETAFAEVNTLIGDATENELKDLENGLRSLSLVMGVELLDSTRAAYQAISAGVPKEDVLDFLPVAAGAAIAGLSDTETAVDALSTIMNSFGKALGNTVKGTRVFNSTAAKAEFISDILFQTVKDGKTTFTELAANIGNVASTAAAGGVKLEELAASYAVLTAGGISTAEATTAINRTILGLIKTTPDAEKAFKRLKIDVEGFREGGTSFATIMQQIAAGTKGSTVEMVKLFPQVRALKGVLILAADGAQKFTEKLIKQTNAAGAANQAFEIMEDTTGDRLTIALNNLKEIMREIGDAVLPGLNHRLEEAIHFFQDINKWIDENNELFSKVVLTVGKAAAAFTGIGATLFIIGKSIVLFTSILTALNPITLIIVATIAALVLAFKSLNIKLEDGSTLFETIKEKFDTFIEFMKEKFEDLQTVVLPAFSSAWNFMKELFADSLSDMKDGIIDIVKKFKEEMAPAIELATKKLIAMRTWWDDNEAQIKRISEDVTKGIVKGFEAVTSAVLAVTSAFAAFVFGLFGIDKNTDTTEKSIEDFEGKLDDLADTIEESAKEFAESMTEIADSIKEIRQTIDDNWGPIREFINGMKVGFGLMGESIDDTVDSIVDFIQMFERGFKTIFDVPKNFLQSVKEALFGVREEMEKSTPLSEASPSMVQNWQVGMAQMSAAVLHGFSSMRDSTVQGSTAIKNTTDAVVNHITGKWSRGVGNLIKTVDNGITTITTRFSSGMTEIENTTDSVLASVDDSWLRTLNNIANNVEASMNKVTNTMAGAGAAALQMPRQWNNAFNQIDNRMGQTVNNFRDQTAAMSSIWSSGVNTMQQLWSSMSISFGLSTSTILDEWARGVERVIQIVRRGGEEIISTLQDVEGFMRIIGGRAIQMPASLRPVIDAIIGDRGNVKFDKADKQVADFARDNAELLTAVGGPLKLLKLFDQMSFDAEGNLKSLIANIPQELRDAGFGSDDVEDLFKELAAIEKEFLKAGGAQQEDITDQNATLFAGFLSSMEELFGTLGVPGLLESMAARSSAPPGIPPAPSSPGASQQTPSVGSSGDIIINIENVPDRATIIELIEEILASQFRQESRAI